ncbi:copper chaperone PCu(A)C [Caenimonas sedimenti]|nr:copper chaperone PCu(A)C [Caenimonas sedimenti]
MTLMLAAGAMQAQEAAVRVDGAWARASVQGQSGTGAFMTLTAREPLTLVGVSTPVAGVAELHEMKMEGDVMKMRAIEGLALPGGRPVELKPGGHHLMLMELKMPLKPDTRVPVTLHLRDAKGALRKLEVSVPVAVRAPHKH